MEPAIPVDLYFSNLSRRHYLILPPLNPLCKASTVEKKDTEQPMLKRRKAIQRAISPAQAVERNFYF
jgi:metallophosphoesterase superfamily enzyme